ncbi:ABC transporter permease [Pseudolysinimonas kribbensis]|uniref:Peptide ABC transporter permease n=1 Tax=Pseudolysinimonas kribbensis TaxID=433641 RepID=A0ABQ6K2C5_9MICO|nr:ABC transporter permease [Pseudolysinimonas kribbensis]GMA94767.1 peptide ABC transporter permease [Pseudolysinimonas kribbensis]
MTTTNLPSGPSAAPIRSSRRGLVPPGRLALRRYVRNPAAVAGAVVLLVMVLAVVFGPMLSPYSPDVGELITARSAPSAAHWLGTDAIGRDQLARVFAGGRVSLTVGFLAALLAVVVGTLVGTLSGWFGGVADAVISRIIDILLSVPPVLVIIVFAGILGPSVPMLIIVFAALLWPQSARIARGVVLSLREQEFVQAARVLGSRTAYIVVRHLIPGVLPAVVVAATILVADAVLSEAAVSFLGAGVQPPQASWGNMLNDSKSITVLSSMPWLWLPPGIAIFATVLSTMAIGDGVRDAIDTRRNA